MFPHCMKKIISLNTFLIHILKPLRSAFQSDDRFTTWMWQSENRGLYSCCPEGLNRVGTYPVSHSWGYVFNISDKIYVRRILREALSLMKIYFYNYRVTWSTERRLWTPSVLPLPLLHGETTRWKQKT